MSVPTHQPRLVKLSCADVEYYYDGHDRTINMIGREELSSVRRKLGLNVPKNTSEYVGRGWLIAQLIFWDVIKYGDRPTGASYKRDELKAMLHDAVSSRDELPVCVLHS